MGSGRIGIVVLVGSSSSQWSYGDSGPGGQ